MIQISFKQALGPLEVKQIRDKVQAECLALRVAPKNGFILLFVVDELSCNIMEHSHASWMDLKIEVTEKGFSALLKDDGVPFDTGAEVSEAKGKAINGESGERRLGLNLIGRLVDKIVYSRDAGANLVKVEKAWQG
jgi:anti-sigma regulatory factor (Ser/Thr protein kinase)